jgi:hypothetical protein
MQHISAPRGKRKQTCPLSLDPDQADAPTLLIAVNSVEKGFVGAGWGSASELICLSDRPYALVSDPRQQQRPPKEQHE